MAWDNTSLPGGDDFRDVTAVFTSASAAMAPDSVLFTEGYTLHDAMSAFQIGEPRLDSGIIVDRQLEKDFPFDPLTPLLPQELCWILDRAFQYEMEWHTGNVLAHTVYTLLHVHYLGDIDPDLIPSGYSWGDPSRPIQLVTMMLRGAVAGMLKCCDLTWRELIRGGLQDAEDWQSDKCEVSLLESFQDGFVLSKIDESLHWLARTNRVNIQWRTALQARLGLRKTLLQLLAPNAPHSTRYINPLVKKARQHLHVIRTHPSPTPAPASPALRAFDPYIARKLNTSIPIRVIELPMLEETWQAIERLLEGWEEVSLLAKTESVTTWEIVGNLRLWMSDPPIRTPYIRSLIQSTFSVGHTVLGQYTTTWLVDRFFFETLGFRWNYLVNSAKALWIGSGFPPMLELEAALGRLLTGHIRGLWLNPSRRRRHFMQEALEWHLMHDRLARIVNNLNITRSNVDGLTVSLSAPIISYAHEAVLLWRLTVIREIVLSGFQLELYTMEEKVFAYWYVTQVIEIHLGHIDGLLLVVERATRETPLYVDPESGAHPELLFQHQFLTALQIMCMGMFTMLSASSPTLSPSQVWRRTEASFFRRYKWAFKEEYDDTQTPVIGSPPQVHNFLRVKVDARQPNESFVLARKILSGLDGAQGWAGRWGQDRAKFIEGLIHVCEELDQVHDVRSLKWDPQKSAWFPLVSISWGI